MMRCEKADPISIKGNLFFYVLRKIPTQNSVSKENLKDQEKKQSRCREDEAIWLYCTYYYYCRYNIINSYNRIKKKKNKMLIANQNGIFILR
jgi:hypothetical protein